MKNQIIGKNIEVTNSIKATVLDKLARMEKYIVMNEDVTCRVVVRSYKVGAKVEITIFTPMMDLRAEVSNDDLYAAVDLALDKLEGQMRKLKTRMDRSNGKMSLGKALAFEYLEDLEDVSDEEDEVVRTKTKYLEPMTVEEAVARMEAIDHPFFLYLDEEDDKISVVYKREDGGYGIFQAENELK